MLGESTAELRAQSATLASRAHVTAVLLVGLFAN